jgi:hypothetical protein
MPRLSYANVVSSIAFWIDPASAVMQVGEAHTLNATNDANENISQVEWNSGASNCPAGTMEVDTFFGNGEPASLGETDLGGFRLVTADQGFTFVIP